MAVAVVLLWVAMVGTTEIATDRTAARAMATTVALAVEAPCTMESRGPCRGKTHGRPRKCHGYCRGPPKSQIMCICSGRATVITCSPQETMVQLVNRVRKSPSVSRIILHQPLVFILSQPR